MSYESTKDASSRVKDNNSIKR
jgi:hypothetical protein